MGRRLQSDRTEGIFDQLQCDRRGAVDQVRVLIPQEHVVPPDAPRAQEDEPVPTRGPNG